MGGAEEADLRRARRQLAVKGERGERREEEGGRTIQNAVSIKYLHPGTQIFSSELMFVEMMPGDTIRWWISPRGATVSPRLDARPVSCASTVRFSSSDAISSIWNLEAWYEWKVFVSCQSSVGSKAGSASSEDIQSTRAEREVCRV